MDSISAEMSSDHDASENGSDIEWHASSEMEISEDAWSLNSSDVVVESEPESVSSSRKKRRKLERVIPPPRPDNEMTRKLRPQKLPLSETSPPPTLVKPSTPSPPASPLIELVRELAPGEEEQGIEVVRGMWETPVIFDFLSLFKDQLLVLESISMDDIERAIVRSNGEGLLTQIHTELLKGFRPKLRVNESNWTSILAKKFRTEELDENPFQPSPGSEAEHYCNATVIERVRILKLLCELRCCEDDLRSVLQEVLKPVSRIAPMPRRRKKKGRITINHYRKAPIGRLSSTILFWLVEVSEPVGIRLYKEVREGVKKNERSSRPIKMLSWELIASNYEELVMFTEGLGLKSTHSRNLKKRLVNEVLPDLERRLEREAKKRRTAERRKASEATIILDQYGGYGRAIRSRTEAKYTFEEYDKTMDEAIDDGEAWKGGNVVNKMVDDASPQLEMNSLNNVQNGFVNNKDNTREQNDLQENDAGRIDV